MHDSSQIRIVDGNGNEIPAQIDVTASWRDGSIRWALAGFTASPQGDYRVEFGEGVTRGEPEHPLRIEQADGQLIVDTGKAVYEFLSDRLLPDSARIGDTGFLANAGAGAYLIDSQGRLSRVAGEYAEVETQLIQQGPTRAVVRREGWYVTEDGERVARAKAWFYFAAGVPYLRITHSLVFTQDTNELWVRDYGLDFQTPESPERVTFALREAGEAEKMPPVVGLAAQAELGEAEWQTFENVSKLLSAEFQETEEILFTVSPDGDEVYLLQDVYAHFLERDFLAVVGRGNSEVGVELADMEALSGYFWLEPWDVIMDVAGDWGDGSYGDGGLTVVVPWMAQQFPKEIAFGPESLRVALWSGRSGRELDFRPATLIAEYWQTWATGRGPGNGPSRAHRVGGLEALAQMESNARGAARTHDIWLLPRHGAFDEEAVVTRANTASNPPLVLADPVWLASTAALWPMHPKDEARFPEEEALLSNSWESLMNAHHRLRRAGFLSWGASPAIRHAQAPFFRLAMASDYGLRQTVWGLYARSGERPYWEFGSRFNRYLGDWELSHWTEGEEHQGMFAFRFGNGRSHPPIHWGDYHAVFGHSAAPQNWLNEYHLTGDEYARDLVRMNAEALAEHWDGESLWPHGPPAVNTLITLYSIDWDEELGRKLRNVVHELIDLDVPNGFNDTGHAKFGALYKVGRDMAVLYNYYRVTGDELARQAFLKAVDYKYRFNRVRGAFGGQSYDFLVFSVAWEWTGNPNYLRVVNSVLAEFRDEDDPPGGVQQYVNPFYGVPVALRTLVELEENGALAPFPVLEFTQEDGIHEVRFHKTEGEAVEMGIFVRLFDEADQDAEPEIVVAQDGSLVEVGLEVENAFRTQYEARSDLRDRHVQLTVPADAPGGDYILRLPNAMHVVVLDSTAEDLQPLEK